LALHVAEQMWNYGNIFFDKSVTDAEFIRAAPLSGRSRSGAHESRRMDDVHASESARRRR
jgi:hypothetical protein